MYQDMPQTCKHIPKYISNHVPNIQDAPQTMCQKHVHNMPIHALSMCQITKIQTSKTHREPYLSTCEQPGAYHHRPSYLLHLQQQENNIFIKLYLSLAGLVFGLVTNPNFQQA
jgi:hypothetical protein